MQDLAAEVRNRNPSEEEEEEEKKCVYLLKIYFSSK